MTAPLRRDVTPIEEPFLTLNPRQIVAVGDQLRANGYSNAQVAGLEAWLLRKSLGEPDLTTSQTRAAYRRWLAELADAPRPGRGQRGFAEVAVLAGVTVMAIATAASRTNPDAAAQLALAWSTLRNPDDREEGPAGAGDAQVVTLGTHRPRIVGPPSVSAVHTLAA